MQRITSLQNSKIKLANKLVSKRHREKEGLFLIDYVRDLERALSQGYDVEFAFYCEALADNNDRRVMQGLDETVVYDVPSELMEKASYRQNPGGLVTVMRQKPPRTLDDLVALGAQTLLALVDLRKPGNIGALLRTADAAGIEGVCLVDMALDIYNPNIIRASTGAVFLDNWGMMTTDEAFTFFDDQQIQLVAAHLSGDRSLYDLDLGYERTAIALGTEDAGLDETWVARCDALVKVPMQGQMVDSLNVSVAGAIFMYEVLRQRQAMQ